MSSLIGETDRRIVPRWRPSAQTTETSLTVAKPDPEDKLRKDDVEESLEKNRQDWESDPTLWNALDFVAGAIVAGKMDEAQDALRQIQIDPHAPKSVSKFIDAMESDGNSLAMEDASAVEHEARGEIRESRKRIEQFPWDAIAWIDLARGFTNLGFADKAGRCISTGLQLAPRSRFVLRAAARFYVHKHDHERAQYILRNASAITHDPWLLASEIAVSSILQRKSLFAKDGERLLRADFAPGDLTELAAALGTLETDQGSNNKAKKLLRQSLLGANENSIAQVEWVDRTRLGNVIDLSRVNPPKQHEALAWRGFFSGNWAETEKRARLWFRDQPFSKNAAILKSYVSSDIANDYQSAIQTLQIALRCNPNDLMLSNNLAYAHINLNEFDKAQSILAKIPLTESNDSKVLDATRGLLEFRRGNYERGRELYLRAIDYLRINNSVEQAARAATYLAIEEVRFQTDKMAEAVKRSVDMTRGSKRADILFKATELQNNIRDLIASTRNALS